MTGVASLYAANEATWPAAAHHAVGGLVVREGRGGGSRVSSATAKPGWTRADIAGAEAAMESLGQTPIFMIRQGDAVLDEALAERGYRKVDTTILYSAPVTSLGPAPGPMTAFPHWPPLAVAGAIWAEAGIGPERRAVMDRAPAPRAAFLGRSQDHPAGVAFAAIARDIAVLHALAVRKDHRRQGTAGNILRRAAVWAAEHGADQLVLAVTAANDPARALYASLGMEAVGQYHYRVK